MEKEIGKNGQAKERKPFWADEKAQKSVMAEMKNLEEKAGAWFALLVAPSCLIGVGEIIEKRVDLWGRTSESYGEHIADFLNCNIGERMAEGLIVRLLTKSKKLRKKIFKALSKEYAGGISLEKQRLYDRIVDY